MTVDVANVRLSPRLVTDRSPVVGTSFAAGVYAESRAIVAVVHAVRGNADAHDTPKTARALTWGSSGGAGWLPPGRHDRCGHVGTAGRRHARRPASRCLAAGGRGHRGPLGPDDDGGRPLQAVHSGRATGPGPLDARAVRDAPAWGHVQ